MQSLNDALEAELDSRRSQDLYRRMRCQEQAPGTTITLADRRLLNFGSNNYLGLTEHPAVRQAAQETVDYWGTGASGSRLTTGNLGIHEELERVLAKWKHTEAALLFPSGYQAAIGVIPALAQQGDLILSDELNHASLIDGCRLSRAEVRIYRHADAAHAQELLADRQRYRRCLLITDGVFSMDGDIAPLAELCRLCDETDAWLMVDDAHGTGILGQTGSGTAEYLGLQTQIPIQMGTLSKALGSQGGFLTGSSLLIDYLRNTARSFVYSTGPTPSSVAAALAAVRVTQAEPERRERLIAHIHSVRQGLTEQGWRMSTGSTPIIPLILGGNAAALHAAAQLEAAGLWAPAIRPPTVPEGSARFRISLMATHTPTDLDRLLTALAAIRQGKDTL